MNLTAEQRLRLLRAKGTIPKLAGGVAPVWPGVAPDDQSVEGQVPQDESVPGVTPAGPAPVAKGNQGAPAGASPSASGGNGQGPMLPPPVDSSLAGSPGYQAQPVPAAQFMADVAPVSQSGPVTSPEQVGGASADDVPLSERFPHAGGPQVAVAPAPPPTPAQVQQQLAQHINQLVGNPQSASDVAFGALAMNDDAVKNQLSAAARQAWLDGEKARLSAPSYEEYGKAVSAYQAQADAENKQYLASLKDRYDQLSAAVQAQIAAVPDPNRIPGLEPGTWSRAISFALAANASGMGAPSLAMALEQQLSFGMAQQQADYTKASLNVRGIQALGGVSDQIHQAKLGGFNVQLAAAQQMLSGQLMKIANSLGPTQAGITLQQTAAKIEQDGAKARFDGAKALGEAEKSDAEAAKARGKVVGAGVGGADVANGNPYKTLGVHWTDENGNVVWGKDVSESQAATHQNQLDGIENARKSIDAFLALGKTEPDLMQKIKNRVHLNSADTKRLQVYLGDAQEDAAAVYGDKSAESTRIAELVNKVMADPDSINDVMPQITTQMETARQVLQNHKDTITKATSGKSYSFPTAPQEPIVNSATIGSQIIGDYDPKLKSVNVGSALSAVDAYVKDFQENRLDPDGKKAPTSELIDDLMESKRKVLANRGRAALDKNIAVSRGYTALADGIQQKIDDLKSGADEKRRAAQINKVGAWNYTFGNK